MIIDQKTEVGNKATELQQMILEYETKYSSIESVIENFKSAKNSIENTVSMGAEYVGSPFRRYVSEPSKIELETILLKSAWQNAYKNFHINKIAPKSDREKFEREIESPPEFTFENVKSTFGHYLKDSRSHILRGLAEVFSSLDQAFASHEKVKIGVKGLPKRIILSGLHSYSGHHYDKLKDILNALLVFQGRPMVEYNQIAEFYGQIRKTGEAEILDCKAKGFQNGNIHFFFGKQSLLDINRALAEFYGDVLPDAQEKWGSKHQASKDVAKDLQFYATPAALADRLVSRIPTKTVKVLEPQCGEGALIKALHRKGITDVIGIEVSAQRVNKCQQQGLKVIRKNFLEIEPSQEFDYVVMNPPFYGKHWKNHINHAWKFLKSGGKIISILPVTAIEHKKDIPNGIFTKLPTGSFSESGTNINTVIYESNWK